MARVMGRAASATVRRAPSRAVQRRARRHKVIMESVTQEKKKLRSVICFEAQAPIGYTFIPAGNPQLTTACKERCRDEGLQIHAVSTTPHQKTHNLSQHVHRIGYHFPSTVVATVCSELGLYLTSTASEPSQVKINTDARDAMRDLFPNIPDKDLNQIIKTAFQKGQKKVGTATELPLARRAQLAVVAHIRHVYTNYDRLLKQTSFHEARTTVEQPTLAKVIEWRGDDENGQTVLEDVFREVIVISDDEDSESEEDAAPVAGNQKTTVEILPSDPRTHEIRTQPISNAKTGQDNPREPSEEAPPGFRFVTRVPANHSVNRRGFSRYQASRSQAWTRALKEYREGVQGTEQPRFAGALAEKQSPRYAEKRIAAPETPLARHQDILTQHSEVHRRVIPGSSSIDNQAQRMPTLPLMDRQMAMRHVGAKDIHAPLDTQQSTSAYNFNNNARLTTQESPKLQVFEDVSGPREPYRRAELAQGHRPQDQLQYRRDFMPVEHTPSVGHPRPVSYFSGQNGIDARSVLDRQHMSGPHELRSLSGISGPNVIVSEGDRTFRAPPVASGPRNANVAHSQDVPPLRMDSILRTERLPPQSENRPNARVFVSGPNEKPQNNVAPPGRRPGVNSPNSRPVSNAQESVVPSIENFWQQESWRADASYPLVHMANRMSLRSVTPGRPQPDTMEKDGNGDQTSKRRRLASQGPRIDSRPDPRIARPMGFPISEGFGPRELHRRVEFGPDQWHPYHSDRNLRSDRALNEQWGMRRNPMDGRIVPENPQDRNLYADGFVRPVDHREPPPFEYASRRLAPEVKPKPLGDLSQPSRARQRDLDYLGVNHTSQFQALSDQRGPLPKGVRVARSDHLRTYSDSTTAKLQPHASPSQIPRERPLSGGGFVSSRPSYNPSSQAEQNRPVYVQRVEPQRTEPRQPYYSVPDGRHIVIVD